MVNSWKRPFAAMLSASVLLVAGDAAAQEFCVRIRANSAIDDLSQGSPAGNFTYWKARGALLKVQKYDNGWKNTTGYIYADDDGCVSAPALAGHARIKIRSEGYIDPDWELKVYSSVSQKVLTYTTQSWLTGGTSDQQVDISTEYTLLRLYAYTSYALEARFSGGLDGALVKIFDYTPNSPTRPCGTQNNSAACWDGGTLSMQIWRDLIDDDHSVRKFAVAHELGHVLHRRATTEWNGTKPPSDCTLSQPLLTPSTCTSSGLHSLRSLEWNSCAATEGFANFIAADIWNYHSSGGNPGAWYARGTTAVNVESGHSGYEAKFCEDVCKFHGSSACSTGRGVEMDWMRSYWDFHTNDVSSSVGEYQSHGDMLRLMIEDWDVSTAYDDIEDSLGSSDAQRWTAYGEVNGIDH